MGAEAVVGAEAQQGREQAGPGDELVLVVDVMVALDPGVEEVGGEHTVEESEEEEDKEAEQEAKVAVESQDTVKSEEEEKAEVVARPEEAEEGEAVEDEKEDTEEGAVAEESEIYLQEVTEVGEEADEGNEKSTEKEHEEAEKAEEDSVDGASEAKEEEAKKEEDADGEEQVAEEEEAEEWEQPEEGEKAEEAEEVAVQEEAREEGQKEEEAQEKQEGEEQPEARRGPSLSPLEALGALQSELEPGNKQASRSYSLLKLKSCQRRQRHLEHRSAIIRGIPGFWAKAFVNHSQMSAMISEQDEGILGYLTDLKVEELRFPRECRHILLFFRKNSYFRNEVVVKEYVVSAAGYGPSHSPPIQWHQDFEREAHSRRHHNSSLNFFNWFSDHSFAGASRIAEILMDDLWPNPLQYYVSKKAAGEGTERTTGSFMMLK